MKNVLLLFAMVAFLGTSAFAQQKTCSKSKAACTKSKTACTANKATDAKTVSVKELPACPVAAAAKLASMDKSIEAKTCAKSGKTSYYKSSVCSTSGKAYTKEVKFCPEAKAFVNVAPAKAEAVKAAELGTEKKACTSKKTSCAKKCSAAKKTSLVKEVKLEEK